MLTPGLYNVPPGMVTAVVTHLEMRDRPAPRQRTAPDGVYLEHKEQPPIDWYRDIFRAIGGMPWLWFSRLNMDDETLRRTLHDPAVAVYALRRNDDDLGLLELDFRTSGECELAFFGLLPQMTGQGVGRWLMEQAITHAFARNITRFHVHTCTLDSPQALPFYIRSGFTPLRQQIEIAPDPRLAGTLPDTAGPHVPIFRP